MAGASSLTELSSRSPRGSARSSPSLVVCRARARDRRRERACKSQQPWGVRAWRMGCVRASEPCGVRAAVLSEEAVAVAGTRGCVRVRLAVRPLACAVCLAESLGRVPTVCLPRCREGKSPRGASNPPQLARAAVPTATDARSCRATSIAVPNPRVGRSNVVSDGRCSGVENLGTAPARVRDRSDEHPAPHQAPRRARHRRQRVPRPRSCRHLASFCVTARATSRSWSQRPTGRVVKHPRTPISRNRSTRLASSITYTQV